MANVSSADVTVSVHKDIAKEFFEYVFAAQGDAEYNIMTNEDIDPTHLPEPDADDMIVAGGYANGRWAYASNLEGYFAAPDGDNSGWRYDKEALISYYKLLSKMKRNPDLYFEIDYKDHEGGASFIDIGNLRMDYEAMLEGPSVSSETQEYNITNLMDVFGYDEWEALDITYGDEVAGAWSEYKDTEGHKIEDVDEFVDTYSDIIYDGKFDANEVVAEEQREATENAA